jgi:type II secretory pathway pseudopilin PulG
MRGRRGRCEEGGALIIVLMVGAVVASIALTAATQAWSTSWRRDSEEELIFRGNQYVDAILAYRKEHSGQFPTNLEDLLKQGPRRLRYIRKLYRDPVNPGGQWGLLYLMPGGQGIYDPMAAQAEETVSDDGGGSSDQASSSTHGKRRTSGITPINRNPTGSGVPGVGGAIPGALPAGSTSSLPKLPKHTGSLDSDNVSEPAIGWPIVGVISRASGKVAERTFKVYKGHDRVDEWQFHVFDRGVTLQQAPPSAVTGGSRPPVVGPGFGGNGTFLGAGDGPRPGWLNPGQGGRWPGGQGPPGSGPGGRGSGRQQGTGPGGQVIKPPQPPPGGYQEPPDDPEE